MHPNEAYMDLMKHMKNLKEQTNLPTISLIEAILFFKSVHISTILSSLDSKSRWESLYAVSTALSQILTKPLSLDS